MTEFAVFVGFFSTLLPPQANIQNSVSIESECSRFRRFRENLVEIGVVDSENFGGKNIYKPFENIRRRPTARLINKMKTQ